MFQYTNTPENWLVRYSVARTLQRIDWSGIPAREHSREVIDKLTRTSRISEKHVLGQEWSRTLTLLTFQMWHALSIRPVPWSSKVSKPRRATTPQQCRQCWLPRFDCIIGIIDLSLLWVPKPLTIRKFKYHNSRVRVSGPRIIYIAVRFCVECPSRNPGNV